MDTRNPSKALDACRPEHDRDLLEPEMAPLAAALRTDRQLQQRRQNLQQADQAVQAALHDVEVPSGLAERLLEQVATVDRAADPPTPRRWRFVWGAVATTAAVLALVVAGWLTWRQESLQARTLAELGKRWYGSVPQRWQLASHQPPAYPLTDDVSRAGFEWWQPFATRIDPQGVVFSNIPAGRSAMLFVLRTRNGAALPRFLPRVPQLNTGGFVVGVWKDRRPQQRFIFVLVVQGQQSDYDRLRPPQFSA